MASGKNMGMVTFPNWSTHRVVTASTFTAVKRCWAFVQMTSQYGSLQINGKQIAYNSVSTRYVVTVPLNEGDKISTATGGIESISIVDMM